MMDILKDNKEWIGLKATLQFVEDKILSTIGVCYAVHDLCTHKNYSVPEQCLDGAWLLIHSTYQHV